MHEGLSPEQEENYFNKYFFSHWATKKHIELFWQQREDEHMIIMNSACRDVIKKIKPLSQEEIINNNEFIECDKTYIPAIIAWKNNKWNFTLWVLQKYWVFKMNSFENLWISNPWHIKKVGFYDIGEEWAIEKIKWNSFLPIVEDRTAQYLWDYDIKMFLDDCATFKIHLWWRSPIDIWYIQNISSLTDNNNSNKLVPWLLLDLFQKEPHEITQDEIEKNSVLYHAWFLMKKNILFSKERTWELHFQDIQDAINFWQTPYCIASIPSLLQ